MFSLPLLGGWGGGAGDGDGKRRPPQPFSGQTLRKHARIRGATRTTSVCPYCAVGCSTHVYTKGDEVLDIEGNPESPINQGTLCPKGANIYQIHNNPHRVKHVMWRAPYSDRWERKTMDWALDRIAGLVKETRDETYQERTKDGKRLNAVLSMGSLGGATLDNEENYLMKKLFGAGLQIVSLENQARI